MSPEFTVAQWTGVAPASGPDRVVATILLPMGVTPLVAIVEQLLAEHGKAVRMRYEDEFAVFFLPGS